MSKRSANNQRLNPLEAGIAAAEDWRLNGALSRYIDRCGSLPRAIQIWECVVMPKWERGVKRVVLDPLSEAICDEIQIDVPYEARGDADLFIAGFMYEILESIRTLKDILQITAEHSEGVRKKALVRSSARRSKQRYH